MADGQLHAPAAALPSAADLQAAATRGSFWSLAATAISLPLFLAGTIVAARVLGPAGFGGYALLTFLWPLFLVIADFGFGAATAWEVSTHSLINAERARAAVSSYATWNLCKLPVLTGAGFFLMRGNSWYALAYAVITVAYLELGTLQMVLAAERKFKVLSVAGIVASASATAALIAACVAGGSYRVAFLASIGGQLAALPIVAACADVSLARASLRPTRFNLGRGFRQLAGASYVSWLTNLWVFGRSETVFLGAFGHAVAQGRFGAATTIAARATLLSDALYASLDTSLVALRSASAEHVEPALRRLMRLGGALGIVTAVVVMPPAVLLPPVAFGADYAGIGGAIAALTLASVVYTGLSPITSWVFAERRTRAMVAPGVVAAAVDVALSVALIPRAPLVGAVTASVAATCTFVLVIGLLGPPTRQMRRELLRVAAYVVPLVAVPAVISLALADVAVAAAVLISYGVSIAVVAAVLLLAPPLAERADVDGLVRVAPRSLRPVVALVFRAFVR